MYLLITLKQFSFHSKVRLSVLVLLSKQDLIFVGKGIYLICYHMGALGWSLEFKVSMKILQEIPIEGILSKLLRKLSLLLRIVPIK